MTTAWDLVSNFVTTMSLDSTNMEKFFNFILNKVEISVLEIPNDVDASSVFEALNARGKSLDDVDLLRNLFYSYFSENTDHYVRKTVHNNLEQIRVILRNSNSLHEYFRCYLQCQYGFLQKTRFYREARHNVEASAASYGQSSYVEELVSGLARSNCVELFRTIMSSKVSAEIEKSLPTNSNKRSLTVFLQELRRYKVTQPLVFALLYRYMNEGNKDQKLLSKKYILRSISDLASFVMRTAFVSKKFEPSRFELNFANCANRVFSGKSVESLDITDDLKDSDSWSVMNDKSFVSQMTTARFTDNSRALRFLFGINAQTSKGSDVLNIDKCSVDHILPISPEYWSGWEEFKDASAEEWVYWTGNFVVVTKRENRADSKFNSSYEAKRSAYQESSIKMARDIASKHDNWSPEVIKKRSKELAKYAAITWKFSTNV